MRRLPLRLIRIFGGGNYFTLFLPSGTPGSFIYRPLPPAESPGLLANLLYSFGHMSIRPFRGILFQLQQCSRSAVWHWVGSSLRPFLRLELFIAATHYPLRLYAAHKCAYFCSILFVIWLFDMLHPVSHSPLFSSVLHFPMMILKLRITEWLISSDMNYQPID